jgi:hypothetical protein
MQHIKGKRYSPRWARITAILACTAVGASTSATADEGGISFWVPGFFGSLAAAPAQPGFALANIYYHTSVSAGADVAFARQVNRGNLTTNFTGNLNLSLKGDADLGMAAPSYTFAEKFLGAQVQLAMLVPYGRSSASVNGTLTGNLGLGGPGFAIGGARSDAVTGFGDLAPMASLRWNEGVNNYMTYVTGNLTVGRYDQASLANLGIGHNAVDAGAGYTYFNPQTGYEFSSVLGFTYNLENDHTQYQNGVDMHLDWGASRFLTKQFQLGAVGYFYKQLSCDSGTGDRVGCFESRVAGIGPQLGYIVPLNNQYQGYFNVKGYWEFADQHRPSGWNLWLTFAVSPAAPGEAPPKAPIVRK